MQEDKDKAYLGLIRNFKRLFWFILLEFGNSAVVDKTFVYSRQIDLDELKTLMKTPIIIDAKNILSMQELESLDFTYDNVGRGKSE